MTAYPISLSQNAYLKPLLFILGLFLGLASIGYLSTLSVLSIDMDSDIKSELQVYWADESGNFSEQQSSTQAVQKGQHHYWFLISKYNKSTRFRIDPLKNKGDIKLYSINLYTFFYYPVDINLSNDTVASHQIETPKKQSNTYLQFKTSGKDPQIETRLILTHNPWLLLVLMFVFATILFKSKQYALFFVLGFSSIYLLLFLNQTRFTFQAQVQQPQSIKVFWKDVGQSNSYTRANSLLLTPDKKSYSIATANLSNMEVLYLQADKSLLAQIKQHKMYVQEPGFKNIEIQKSESIIDKVRDSYSLLVRLSGFLFVGLGIGYFVFFWQKKPYRHLSLTLQALQLLFLCALFLSFNLAWQADFNIHPDENAHIASIDYYAHNWIPPTVGDPRALDSYQRPWATSRLDDLGISYFIAGKFKNLVSLFFANETFSARAFNLLLFLLLFALSTQKRILIFCIPLLCSPQIWYLFSYANRGAFALFISILLGWQLVNRHSLLNIFLNTNSVFKGWSKLLLPALLLGILLIEQTNYLLFVLYIFAFLAWRLLFFVTHKKLFFYKCVVFLMLALSVALGRYSVDLLINGPHKYAQRVAYAEANAGADFKPSIASTDRSYPGLRLKDKGIPFQGIFNPEWDWHKMTFKSFVGFYGYYAEYSPRWYYAYVAAIYVIILLLIIFQTITRLSWPYRWFTLLSLIAVSGGIWMGMLFSWLYDFQPQGRYIFPIIPIILVYLYQSTRFWTHTAKSILLSLTLILIILSFYSFNEVALNYLFA